MKAKFIYRCTSWSGEGNTIKKTVEQAVKEGKDLRNSNLSGTDLRGADLLGADLLLADLRYARLQR